MKFTVYANCQGSAIANTLLQSSEFSRKYHYVKLPAIQYLSSKDVEKVISLVGDIDLFIYQPIQQTNKRPKELSSNFLVSKLKSDARFISFPSIYFNGYFPHLQTFNGYTSELHLVHDYFIAYLCAMRFSESKTYQIIQQESLYPKNISLELCEHSLSNLRARENKFSLDIKLSSFIEKNYKTKKLFNQFNHPGKDVIKFTVESILRKLRISLVGINCQEPSFLRNIITPIYKSTYKNLNLTFNEDFDTYSVGKKGIVSQQNIISGFFNFYKSKDLESIKEHVSQVKPFIPKVVKKMGF